MNPRARGLEEIGFDALLQIVEFFEYDGALVVDLDDSEPVFETPIMPPVPEDCGYVVEFPEFMSCQ